jgi:LysM domain
MNAIEELERYYVSDQPAEGRGDAVGITRGQSGTASERSQALSPATDGQASTSATAEDEMFVTHVLTKADTLAGLAVRYNVAVSDIKRANGLMSENMMWGRCGLPNCRDYLFVCGPGRSFAQLNRCLGVCTRAQQ